MRRLITSTKALLSLLLLLVGGVTGVSAQTTTTVTIDFTEETAHSSFVTDAGESAPLGVAKDNKYMTKDEVYKYLETPISFTPTVASKVRFLESSGSYSFRINKSGALTISVDEGYEITAISITKSGSGGSIIFGTDTEASTSWSGNASSVSLSNSSSNTCTITAMSITYAETAEDTRLDPELSFASDNCDGTLEDGTIVTPTLSYHSGLLSGDQTIDDVITWTSSNQEVVTNENIADGAVIPSGVGTTTITATFAGNTTYKGGSASYTLIVTSSKTTPTLSFTPSTASYTIGQTDAFVAPTLSGVPDDATVEYVSSNTDVATVVANTGDVTFVGAGTTTITATTSATTSYLSGSASYELTVVDPNAKGTFGNPYTPSEILAMSTAPSDDVWVMGEIIGCGATSSQGAYTTTIAKTNIAIADQNAETYSGTNVIAVEVPNKGGFRTVVNLSDNPDNMNKIVAVYGSVENYFGRKGVKSTSKVSGLGSIKIRTAEGYATFATDCAFEVPTGVQCAVIPTISNDKLVINYDYTEGEVVPTGTPVLVKAPELADASSPVTYDIVYTNSTKTTPTNNLLKAGTGEAFTAEIGHLYYKLAYDDYTAKTDLGFYWGAADGGAFTVPVGNAYLDVTSTVSQAPGFSFSGALTGIESATNNGLNAEKKVYTLDGRRVNPANMTRGLYIVNGKKVIIK